MVVEASAPLSEESVRLRQPWLDLVAHLEPPLLLYSSRPQPTPLLLHLHHCE